MKEFKFINLSEIYIIYFLVFGIKIEIICIKFRFIELDSKGLNLLIYVEMYIGRNRGRGVWDILLLNSGLFFFIV